MKSLLTLLLILTPLSLSAEQGVPVQQASGTQPAPSAYASIDAYTAHLEKLKPLVSECATGRNIVICDPKQIGTDDEVVLPSGERRMVRYDWLRALFEKAQKPDEPKSADEKNTAKQDDAKQKSANSTTNKRDANNKTETDEDAEDDDKPPAPGDLFKDIIKPRQPSTSELLKKATERLESDLNQAHTLSAIAMDAHAREHQTLNQILSESAYRNLKTETEKAQDTWLEKINAAINKFFEKMNAFGQRSPWIWWTLLTAFFVLISVLLIWALIQSERRMRLRLTPEGGFGPAPGAASARDWQLWLKDAEAAAAAGEWREAIHFLYWASISRLESMRLWPADRARTPREYLALLQSQDPRRAGLLALTRSFERTWYGGRMAEEAEFASASAIAKELIAAGGKR